MRDSSATQRIAGLDVLRALAIVLVIVAHYPKPEGGLVSRMLNFGWTGVDLFFVLSGYLIAGQLFAAQTRGIDVLLWSFYLRRFLRTLPNYYVVLAIYALLAIVAGTKAPEPTWKFAAFLQNFAIPSTFTPSWSLCVEEQFYLLFPIVAIVVARSRRSNAGVVLLASILVFALALRSAIWFSVRPDLLTGANAVDAYMANLYFPTWCRLDGITLGVGIAALKYFRPSIWSRCLQHGDALLAASGVFLVLSVLAFWKRYAFVCSTVGFTLISITFALFTVAFLSSGSLTRFVRLPGAQTIAQLSYSIYLTHSLALDSTLWIARSYGLPMVSIPAIAVAVTLMALYACLLYFLIERPFLALRDRRFAAPQQTVTLTNRPVLALQHSSHRG